MKIVWSPRARERVVEIGDYITAQDRPAAAANWVASILASVERLHRHPFSGRMVPERRQEDLREVIHRGFRVIYRVYPDYLVVVTVRHSRLPIIPGDIDLA